MFESLPKRTLDNRFINAVFLLVYVQYFLYEGEIPVKRQVMHHSMSLVLSVILLQDAV